MPYSVTLESATVSDINQEQLAKSADSFDFKAETVEQKGLLLPAIQAASGPGIEPLPPEDGPADSFEFAPPHVEPVHLGLLLPAVQKATDDAVLDFALTGDGDFAKGDGHGGWIDILSMDKGTHKPHSEEETRPAGLQSDGELVQASEIESGDFML